MRASNDEEFAAVLEDIGVGATNLPPTSQRPEDQQIHLGEFAKRNCLVNAPREVIKRVFGTMGTPQEKLRDFQGAAILTPDNKAKHEYNELVGDFLILFLNLTSVSERDVDR